MLLKRTIQKPRTIEQILQSSGVDFNHKVVNYNAVQKKNNYKRALIYDSFSKNIVNKTPGLLKEFIRFFKSKSEIEYKDSAGRFTITRIRSPKEKLSITQKLDSGFSTKEAFLLETNVDGEYHRFFIKYEENAYKSNHNTYSQFIASQLQKLVGLDIITPHLAYTELGKKNLGFLVSDFTDMITLRMAYMQNIINSKQYNTILKKIINLEKMVNKKYPEIYSEISKHKLTLRDMLPRSVFYEVSSGKFYFFDPWLAREHIYTKILFYLQRHVKTNRI